MSTATVRRNGNNNLIRIAILAERLGTSAGGTEVYERCLLKALHEQARESGDVDIIPVLAWRRGLDLLPHYLHPSCRFLKPEGKIGTVVNAGWAIRRLKPDVVHCCAVVPPLLGDVPVLATVHDLGFIRRKEHYPALLSWRLVKVLQYAIRKADLLVAVSESTRQDLLALTAAKPEKVISILNGLDEQYLRYREMAGHSTIPARYGVCEPYIMYAGTLEPRKNVPVLIEAFDKLKASDRFSGQLVLLGSRQTFLWEVAQKRIDDSPFRGDIIQTGYIPDNEVPSFYAGAKALAFLSLYEGFGFPILEAMASGVPVVCSNSTCMPEIAGDAALLVNPEDSDRIADALSRVLNDERVRGELIAKGLLRAKRLTWQRAASQFLDAYRILAKRAAEHH